MTEEIKEILNYLKSKYDIVDELGNDYKKVKFKDCKLLLNYITNLQKENENLKNKINNLTNIGQTIFTGKSYNDLALENEKLKENNKRKTSRCTERNHKIRARDRIIERRNKKINKLEDCKQRNEKAVEYIEKYLQEHVIDEYPDEQSTFYDEKDRFIPNAKEVLLNILKGAD